MHWKDRYRSFYYATMAEVPDVALDPKATGLLVIDVQNAFLDDQPRDRTPAEQMEFQRWQPFFRRMRSLVIPSIQRLLATFRAGGRPVYFVRIAGLTADGSDRSLSQRRPGFNNLRLLLHNMGIRDVVVAGIFTDQCVSGTVRSLADESFNVVMAEDALAAGTDELHHKELEILNNIYAQVMSTDDVLALLGKE